MKFVQESVLPVSVEAAFAFHERPDAFELLQPPWERVQILRPPSSLEVGTRVEVRAKIGPLWMPVVAEHVAYEKNRRFEDVMRRGPFARWHHQHIFLEHEAGCLLRDEIDYELPFGPLGRIAARLVAQPRLRRLFAYRHEVTLRELLADTPVA